jgi:hypothetical protein
MADGKKGGFREAMARGEVASFLRGDGDYRKVPRSDFAGEDAPTDTWQALQEIYDAAKEADGIENALSEGISALLSGTAADVYLAVLYLTRLSLAKQGGRLPLQVPLHELLLSAREGVEKHRPALSGELVFPNGFVKKASLEDIQGWNEVVFLPCCGVDILQPNK